MAIIDGVSTHRGVKRPRKEGEKSAVREQQLAQQEQADIARATQTQQTAGVQVQPKFDPRKYNRGGMGLAAPAGAPVTPFTASTLDEMASLVNQEAKSQVAKASAVPTTVEVKPPEIQAPAVEAPKPPSLLDRTKAIREEAAAKREAINAEPARLTKAQDLADIAQQEKDQLAAIDTELSQEKEALINDKTDFFMEQDPSLSFYVANERAKNAINAMIKQPEDEQIISQLVESFNDPQYRQQNKGQEFEIALSKFKNASKARDFLDDMAVPKSEINKQIKAYQESLGYDEDEIMLDDFTTKTADLFTGRDTNPMSIASFVRNAQSQGMPDAWIGTQLEAINNSLSANQGVKDMAKSFLSESKFKPIAQKLPTKAELEAQFLAGQFESPQQEQAFLNRMQALSGKAEEKGGFDNLSLSEKETVLAVGKIAYGTKISDKESDKVFSIVSDPESAGKSRFDIVMGVLGYKPTKNQEVGKGLINKLSQNLGKDEGLSTYPLDALSKQLSDDNIPGAINLVEKLVTQRAKEIEGNDFISESFVKRGIEKVNDLQKSVADAEKAGVDTLGNFQGTISDWLGRFKGTEEAKIKTDIVSAIAEMRNKLLGSAVTPTEEAFLEPLLPELSDRPDVFQNKLDKLKRQGLIDLNSIRSTYSLPELNEQELLDKKEREKLYTTGRTLFTAQGMVDAGMYETKDQAQQAFSNVSTEDQTLFGQEFNKNPDGISEMIQMGGTPQDIVDFFKSQNSQATQKKNNNSDGEIVETNFTSFYGTPVRGTKELANALEIAQENMDVPLKITDSLRSTESQRASFESGKAGVAPPGTSFHETGNAIDLNQQDPNMKDEKVFAALREAGLQQHPDEWWHWSIGEFA